jgi:hypothetical protein
MRELLDRFRGRGAGRHSGYWFDESYYDTLYSSKENGSGSLVDAMKMAGFKRSCANFVHILTGRPDIRVEYSTQDESYTDGKSVTISGNVSMENFDSTVGLALHESSHIVYTDFQMLTDILTKKTIFDKYITKSLFELAEKNIPGFKQYAMQAFEMPTGKTIPFFTNRQYEIMFFLFKDLLNWIEDRRIDNETYTSAPGYRPYYTALYKRYWASKEVDKMVKSKKLYRSESVDSYVNRIINLMNEYTDLKALKGLQEISDLIDVPNISRMKTTDEVGKLTAKVMKVIFTNARKWSELDKKNKKFEDGKPEPKFGDETLRTTPGIGDLEGRELTPDEAKELAEKLKEIIDLISGEVEKVDVSEEMKKKLAVLVDSQATIKQSGGQEFGGVKVNVMTIERLNDSVVGAKEFDNLFFELTDSFYSNLTKSYVNRGIVLGSTLGKRIQVRNEERSLKYTRQVAGKLDRRMVSALGYDYENVFSRVETDKYNKCHLHVSIDASGSMQRGEKFHKAIETSVAIAKACSMVKNLECVISFRSTLEDNTPVVFIAYDSRKNGMPHIQKYFPVIKSSGSTPESLCFEALSKYFPVATMDSQFIFVNMSDGYPEWYGRVDSSNPESPTMNYGGDAARNHCHRIVKGLEKNHGATILAYFIGSSGYMENFKRMYGEHNSFNVNEASIVEIARTMNKKFLEAGKTKVSHE